MEVYKVLHAIKFRIAGSKLSRLSSFIWRIKLCCLAVLAASTNTLMQRNHQRGFQEEMLPSHSVTTLHSSSTLDSRDVLIHTQMAAREQSPDRIQSTSHCSSCVWSVQFPKKLETFGGRRPPLEAILAPAPACELPPP